MKPESKGPIINIIIVFIILISINLIGFLYSSVIMYIGLTLDVLLIFMVILLSKYLYLSHLADRGREENIINGFAKEYFPNSSKVKVKVEISNSQRHGKFIEYYENGNLAFETQYKNGIQFGPSHSYYDNGNLSQSYNLNEIVSDEMIKNLNGKRHGRIIEYHKNGNISFESQFKNGIQFGLTNSYYENGIIYRSFHIEDDISDEIVYEYYTTGKLKFIYTQRKLVCFSPEGIKTTEIYFAIKGNYKFSENDTDMDEFLKNNVPTGEWVDYYNEEVILRYEFVGDYDMKSDRNIIRIKRSLGPGLGWNEELVKYKFVKGFHANFISEIANIRKNKPSFYFSSIIIRRGPPGLYNGYSVQFRPIQCVGDILQFIYD
jgi:antitoxin component YwqK of YwqJK toxin-antitoxin module